MTTMPYYFTMLFLMDSIIAVLIDSFSVSGTQTLKERVMSMIKKVVKGVGLTAHSVIAGVLATLLLP